METELIKNVVIGSGEGGKYLAWHLAGQGEPVTVIERRMIGGSCPNTNCLPSKNEIWSAKVAHLISQGSQFGIHVDGHTVDMTAVRRRKREMVDGLIALHLEKFRASGAQLVMGSARMVGERQLEVRLNDGGTRLIQAERLFLNLGTHAAIPEIHGLRDAQPMTHVELLEIDRIPEHLIVIGGGYVGLEFAQAFGRLGSHVTILQQGPQLLKDQDEDIAEEITRQLTIEGIRIVTSARLTQVTGKSGQNVTVTFETASGSRIIEGSDILVAAGRVPNTVGIGLDRAGINLDTAKYIQVNERLETSAENVWAIGECAGTPQFTHASLDDFRVIRDNLSGIPHTTSHRVIPSCLFTDPQVARIGLNEKEARQKGIQVRVARLPMAAVLRTRTLDETGGFMKALVDQQDHIVGFSMVGPDAGEVMAAIQMAMIAELPFTSLRDAMLAHPTMAEGLNSLFGMLEPAALTVLHKNQKLQDFVSG